MKRPFYDYPAGVAGGLWHWSHAVRAHHLIVLVLNYVTMPNIQTCNIKPGLYTSYFVRIRNYRILPARFPRFRRRCSIRTATKNLKYYELSASFLSLLHFLISVKVRSLIILQYTLRAHGSRRYPGNVLGLLELRLRFLKSFLMLGGYLLQVR